MAIPAVLIWLVPAAVALIAGAAAYEALRERAEKKVLAIVGDSKSGKTTLTRYLAQGIVGETEYARTVADTKYGGTTVELRNGTRLHIGDLIDVPGEDSAWLSWKSRVEESDYVLYLLRSHDLRRGGGGAADRTRRDLQQIRLWLKDKAPEERPPVLLIFSFRDQDQGKETATTAYADELIAAAGLKTVYKSLSRVTTVRYVSGSLATKGAADDLLEQIGGAL